MFSDLALRADGALYAMHSVYAKTTDAGIRYESSIWMSKADWKRSWKPWLRGTAFGFPFGSIPAGGAEIPTFLSYATEKKLASLKTGG